MNRVHIPRVEYASFPTTGAGWAFTYEDSNKPSFFCGECRHWFDITLHSISTEGEVNASILCPGKKAVIKDEAIVDRVPCTFHEFAVFDNWPANAFKVAGEENIKYT